MIKSKIKKREEIVFMSLAPAQDNDYESFKQLDPAPNRVILISVC